MQKLAPFATIKHALSAVIQFRNAGIRIGLPWSLVLALISFLDHIFFTVPETAGNTNLMVFRPTDFAIAGLSLVIFSSIAVNWHRYILLDEITAPEKIFRLDRPVWNYALRTLLIMIIALVPVLGLSLIFISTLPQFAVLLTIPFFLAGIYVMRMSVALPAMALERGDFGIRDALRITQGNNLQFAGLLALNSLILLATFFVLGILLTIVGSVSLPAAKSLAFVLSVPVNLFLSLFSVSLLSSLYGFFVEQRKF
jgi:hypothetical protein